ncbi:MAG TPA: glycoside hydrolase family 92 protein, partial [Chthonomonadaceae bacterium]|nr:glycoside hydrolase family 92 protein [Chthonomonadaceae bacterium]
WTQACREGGWFPQWASPGYRACMVGSHVDAVIADGVMRGVRNFDVETAYAGMRKHAFEPGDAAGSYGRIGIADYLEKGYVPADRHHESVARSLDYAYDDFCIAQVAGALGKEEDRKLFLQRARNYRNHYDPSIGFMRGRYADGSWAAFAEFRWGDPFVEGGPWQSTWAVPHDPEGLIALMGGPEPFIAKLEQMLAQPPYFEVGHYGFEIHEMTEMACADFGQYAHSNQPVHHAFYLFTAAGRPDRTQYWVNRVLNELYTPDAFPGDEDNGEMSAWFLLSALGIYPLCPGHPSWVLGAPLFDRARIRLSDGKELILEAERTQATQIYTEKLTVNGNIHESLWIDHTALTQGTTLRFTMTDTPSNLSSYPDEALPFSLSQI